MPADLYVATLTQNIEAAYETARKQLQTSLKRMKRDYDVRILQRMYGVGDVVYLLDTVVLKGKCKKLSRPWKGPAVIVEKISAALYRVRLRKSVFVVNHDWMKPCRDRVLPDWVKAWLANPEPADVTDDADGSLYCSCRKPWQGRFMIQCDGCDEWFHGSCVNVTPSEAVSIDKFYCRTCLVG